MQHKIWHRDLENCNSLCQHRHSQSIPKNDFGVGIWRSAIRYASISISKHDIGIGIRESAIPYAIIGISKNDIGIGTRKSAIPYAVIGISINNLSWTWHRKWEKDKILCQYVNDTGHTSQQMKCISTHIRQENPTLQLHKPQFPSLTKNNQHSSRSELTFTTGCYSICITVRRFSYVRFHWF